MEFCTLGTIPYVSVTHLDTLQVLSLIQPHDCNANIFGRPPIFDQKVDHALRFDEQIAAQKEDPKDYSQWKYTENCDLDHPSDEEVPFIWEQDWCSPITGHHRPCPIATANQSAEILRSVGIHPFFH